VKYESGKLNLSPVSSKERFDQLLVGQKMKTKRLKA